MNKTFNCWTKQLKVLRSRAEKTTHSIQIMTRTLSYRTEQFDIVKTEESHRYDGVPYYIITSNLHWMVLSTHSIGDAPNLLCNSIFIYQLMLLMLLPEVEWTNNHPSLLEVFSLFLHLRIIAKDDDFPTSEAFRKSRPPHPRRLRTVRWGHWLLWGSRGAKCSPTYAHGRNCNTLHCHHHSHNWARIDTLDLHPPSRLPTRTDSICPEQSRHNQFAHRRCKTVYLSQDRIFTFAISLI